MPESPIWLVATRGAESRLEASLGYNFIYNGSSPGAIHQYLCLKFLFVKRRRTANPIRPAPISTAEAGSGTVAV
jgi:hypothetical protein